LNTVLLS